LDLGKGGEHFGNINKFTKFNGLDEAGRKITFEVPPSFPNSVSE